jgi:hypothetical protein
MCRRATSAHRTADDAGTPAARWHRGAVGCQNCVMRPDLQVLARCSCRGLPISGDRPAWTRRFQRCEGSEGIKPRSETLLSPCSWPPHVPDRMLKATSWFTDAVEGGGYCRCLALPPTSGRHTPDGPEPVRQVAGPAKSCLLARREAGQASVFRRRMRALSVQRVGISWR